MVRSALLWPTQDPLRFVSLIISLAYTQHRTKTLIIEKLLLACLKWRQLRHPNILPLFGADLSVKDTPTLVQPWIERGNIRDYIYHCNPKPGPSQLLSWLLDIAQGMKYLHEMGIHHGDLRGNNILLTDTNVPVIADIFMSTFRGEWTITFPRRKGTFERWLAPESIQAIEPSEKADIFSFGFVCIELFTGEIPFPALSDQDVVEKSRRGEIPEKPDNMPEEVWFLAKDCWCSDPAQRPPMIDVVNRLCGAERMNS
ncbi:hypothetical protein QCA50_014534 [Cerrena zonata]|uniref:Protein kinase domain-containing protein n=1 Tax=Cerrena zonata TaxID=2478898 RepID=A0AAW0G004_9APHY